jgi:hypothetical protein
VDDHQLTLATCWEGDHWPQTCMQILKGPTRSSDDVTDSVTHCLPSILLSPCSSLTKIKFKFVHNLAPTSQRLLDQELESAPVATSRQKNILGMHSLLQRVYWCAASVSPALYYLFAYSISPLALEEHPGSFNQIIL